MGQHISTVRWRLWWLLWAVFMLMSSLLRLGLMSLQSWEGSGVDLLLAFGLGSLFDALSGATMLAALAWFLALMPTSAWRNRWGRGFMQLGTAVWLALFGVLCIAEYLFWVEFQSRFNFIAVDYLVYTHEVLGNIWQSYPVGRLLLGVLMLAMLGSHWLWRRWMSALPPEAQAGGRWAFPCLLSLALLGSHALVSARDHERFADARLSALAGSGVYEFFAALRNSELDYEHFYASQPIEQTMKRLRAQLPTPHARLATSQPMDLTRIVSYPGPEHRWNVVLVTIESLSAEFLGVMGDQRQLTPHLDALARDGLLFTRMYATGTRTVRGLEALSLSVPPTPGQSIVKRPDHADLFSLGSVLSSEGYHAEYVYGGYGYFDNMNEFFGHNHYQVVDRTAIDEPVHHENIWGVADEDLFSLALKRAGHASAQGQPFFLHVMTTSNHRPYTYPEGRIDIPSHTGREGAVKYTDWAVGDFIRRAQQQPWFHQTVFVFVADHCASSAGKTELPVEKYHIPAIVYAPGLVPAGRVDRLASQIDLPPTLLGLLNMSYTSRFLGYDLRDLEPGRERAFVSTYQNLGFWRGDTLVELSPRQTTRLSDVNDQRVPLGDGVQGQDLLADAVSWYQGAAWAYRHGGLAAMPVTPP